MQNTETMSPPEAGETPFEIDVHAFLAWRRDCRDITLIDCREDDEFAIASIEGAELMPMSRWNMEIHKLNSWTEKPIVVYCHHGRRSLQVVKWLRANGFPTARSLAGGIDAWSTEIDSRVPRY
jgi:rhodanese-related sulfurtransferase